MGLINIKKGTLLVALIDESKTPTEGDKKKLLSRNLDKELGYKKGIIIMAHRDGQFTQGVVAFTFAQFIEIPKEILKENDINNMDDANFVIVDENQVLINY